MLVVQAHAGRLGTGWHAPYAWDDAASLLERYGPEAAPAGGATYLMWRAAHGEPMPRQVVSLHRIEDGKQVAPGSVGALVTLRALERAPATGGDRALSMAAAAAAGPAVRTVATLGGNLASGFRQADLVPALLAIDASVHLHDGTRLPVAEVVARGTGGRLITRVTHDLAAEHGWSGAAVKLARRGMDLSVGLAAVAVRVSDGMIHEARVAVGSLYGRPCRLTTVERALVGAPVPPGENSASLDGHPAPPDGHSAAADWRGAVRDAVSELVAHGPTDVTVDAGSDEAALAHGPISGFVSDAEASAGYRARIAGPLVERALAVAIRSGPHGHTDQEDVRL
ncbi:FAD binding domain-containing protein [Plantactinospora sp. GCM10030261]|uniref:FAD binding domain-containing protein n=1 Tax=Plantactinospora sp. GCM10030261 TaxID=3273420 RepID=UPI003606E81C